jgi:hypothetical protein
LGDVLGLLHIRDAVGELFGEVENVASHIPSDVVLAGLLLPQPVRCQRLSDDVDAEDDCESAQDDREIVYALGLVLQKL